MTQVFDESQSGQDGGPPVRRLTSSTSAARFRRFRTIRRAVIRRALRPRPVPIGPSAADTYRPGLNLVRGSRGVDGDCVPDACVSARVLPLHSRIPATGGGTTRKGSRSATSGYRLPSTGRQRDVRSPDPPGREPRNASVRADHAFAPDRGRPVCASVHDIGAERGKRFPDPEWAKPISRSRGNVTGTSDSVRSFLSHGGSPRGTRPLGHCAAPCRSPAPSVANAGTGRRDWRGPGSNHRHP